MGLCRAYALDLAALRRALVGACLTALATTAGQVSFAGANAGRVAALVTVDDADVPSLLDDGDAHSLRQAIQQSLSWLAGQPSGQRIIGGPRTLTLAEQMAALRRMLELLADDPSAEVLEGRVFAEFDLLKSAGRDDGVMLVTGYHQPIVAAAEAAGAEYRVPILAVPSDLAAARRGSYWTSGDRAGAPGRAVYHARGTHLEYRGPGLSRASAW